MTERVERPPRPERQRGHAGIELSEVGPDEWRTWRELRLAALADAPDAFLTRREDWENADEARWRARLAGAGLAVVARLDGEPVGMVAAKPDGPDAVELVSMWVAPAARGTGVADALVAYVVDWARQRDLTAVELGVMVGNPRARALYRRHGFRPLGPVRSHDDGRVEELMRLDLTSSAGTVPRTR